MEGKVKIEHVALWTADIEKMKDFYTKYFNGSANKKYVNDTNKFESYFIEFGSGARLEIMQIPGLIEKEFLSTLKGYTHIAMSVGSKSEVDDHTNFLRKGGYVVYSEPRLTGDGYYESVILDPDGNLVEITE